MSRFDECFDFLMRWEGEKFEDDPNDPGGRTKFGIDQRSHPNVNIRALTREEAKTIYYENEWRKCGCGKMPEPWDLAVLDSAVNIGMGWTIPALQRSVGTKADGFVGPETITAVRAASDTDLEHFFDAREQYYRALPRKLRTRFLRGWLNRVEDVRFEARKAV